jgi:putative ABC transport system permease protein
MVNNYFKIALRNLLKDKGYSAINIGGLALGMTCFLLITYYVQFERSYEVFHKEADNILRVTLDLYKGSEFVMTDCETYPPLGPMLKDKMPEVVDYVRMMQSNDGKIKIGTKKFFDERSYFADPSVFKVFSYKIIQGDVHNPLSAPYQVVVTESAAKKYFGTTDAVGETVEIGMKLYKVTAVMEDVPVNTHLKFDFLMSHATIPKFWKGYSDESSWDGNNEFTYLLMKPNLDLFSFNKKLADFSISLKEKIGTERFVAEHIKDIHLYSNKTFEPEVNGNAKTVYFLFIVALFIVGLAWVNYINLSTAKAIERAREVGIRKVMGSHRSQLILQFLSESFLINLQAAALTVLLIKIALPFFRDLSAQPLPLNIFQDATFWYLLTALLVVGVFLSGVYPAIVLSSFEPVKVLKGKFKSSSHGQWLRKGLVVFQFSATAILILCLCVVYLQINYLRNYDLGMKIDQTLVLRTTDLSDSLYMSRYHSLKTELLKNPSVQMVARSGSVPGLGITGVSTTNSVFRYGQVKRGESYNYYHFTIDADFIPTLQIQIAAGRNFDNDLKNKGNVILNEEAVRALGFKSSESAIGEKITFRTNETDYSTVVGVVKNFHLQSPKEQQVPIIFWCSDLADYFSVRLKSNDMQASVAQIRNAWDDVFKGHLFSYFFLDEKYNQQYKADTQFGEVIGTFSALAIFIACLGLFGLSSFTILQRTKEIGIRKILGGSVSEIVQLLSKDFIKLILLAGVISIPFAYLAMQEWLSGYVVRVPINVWIFTIPTAMIVFVSFLTIAVQTIRAAQANPVNSLRVE